MVLSLAVVVLGAVLLCWQVLPLIRKVMRSEEKLRETEEKFQLSFDSAAIGMALIALNGYWAKVNLMLCRIVGYSEDELLKMQVSSVVHPDDVAMYAAQLQELIEDKTRSLQVEARLYRKDNQLIWVMVSVSLVRDKANKPLYFIAQLQDISAKKRAEQELSYQAYYDALTGLVNRNQLEQNLDKAVAAALRQQKNFAVFFMDIDHFKKINDTLGHGIGDELLKVVASRLKNCTRITDVAARLGGDEFILILNGISSPESAAVFADKVLDTIIQPIKINEHELHVSISIGISFYPNDGVDYQAILKSADMALYSAKQKGRNNYQFCTPEMNAEIAERVALKVALQEALNRNEFHLDYQSKIDVNSRRVVGVEAFLRWSNPHYGEVAPSKMIPLAEESGIIVAISEWVMLSACRQAKRWQESGSTGLNVVVNISSKQFRQVMFVEKVLSTLKESVLAPYHLEIEVAEALIMQDPEYSLKIIRALKDIGVQVTIDNFGTGYSSLVYLHRFAVDKVKIDRILIQQLAMSSWHGALIVAMIGLAKNLGMRVAAEGIETKEQYDFLVQHGCDELQGYYVGYPTSVEKMGAHLAEANKEMAE